MPEAKGIVSSKGQVTLPKEAREALGVQAGSQVSFEVQPGQVIIRKRVPEAAFRRWRGYLQGKVSEQTTDELMRELRGE